MRVLMAILLVGVAFAGCSEDAGPTAAEDDLGDVDEQLQATSTTGVIRGIVVDPAVVPIPQVTITVMATGKSTTTNENGAFGFGGMEPGTYFLQAARDGYNGTQASVTVVAGVDKPDIVKIQLIADATQQPYVDPVQFNGFLACGFAVFYTSVGCTTNEFLSSQTQSTSIWSLDFDRLPMWTQGELVWEDTQPASGQFIWQIVKSNDPDTPQLHIGYMETTPSPALTYLPTEVIDENAEWILDRGIDYRFFGGPHELCPQHVGDPSVNRFGCGVTIDQSAQVFIHHFYNLVPAQGWRFTVDGDPQVPPP